MTGHLSSVGDEQPGNAGRRSVIGLAGIAGVFVGFGALVAVYLIAVQLTPIINLLGVAPDLEAALYFTVVVLMLLGAGWSLVGLVYHPRRRSST